MPNALYNQLIATAASYIGEEKARSAVGRQLSRCNATPDTLTADQLRSLMNYVTAATTLFLHPDKAKQAELTDKIKALA